MDRTQLASSPDNGWRVAPNYFFVIAVCCLKNKEKEKRKETPGVTDSHGDGEKNASLQRLKGFGCMALLFMLSLLQQSTNYVPHK